MGRSEFPVYVAVKLTPQQAQALKRKAREDDRTVSGFLRRLIAEIIEPESSRVIDAPK